MRARLTGLERPIDDQTAREVLERFKRLITAAVRSFQRESTRGFDAADLQQIARLATLDAYTSFQEEGGRSLSSWVYKYISWRLTEYVKQEPIFEPFDGPVLNGKNPEEKFFTEERRMWLESAIGTLTPRQRTIVCAQLSGESLTEIAPTLGISVSRVYQEAKVALEQLKSLRQNPEK